jgi:hypothetical protein
MGADFAMLDALARLQLTAKRLDCDLRISIASDGLLELIELAGLSEALRVEPRRQSEEREQRVGVEEERELDDPPV